ncbi:19287_t:CDS:10 [Racocetra fulgida]|uniref:19287_t:CDS:1 n=1 Tax=Racocetra fulgida TaxID=60492 RepID=A0A9N8WAJ4_9GLOM|nr:19287_t:CDS:10 [Racocetra fulgida]
MDSSHNTTINSYIKEIEGYLNNKRILYEAEGRREFVPLIDRTVQMIRLIKDPGTTEGHSNVTEQSNRSSTQRTFDRPPEKMYHYADGEAIDCAICIEQVEPKHAQVRLSCDFKCPYCRLEVESYAKQPRTWEYPPNGPPTPQNLNDHNDMSHPGELDFANFQRDDYLDEDDFSDSDRIVYEIANGGDPYNNSETDSDDDSNSSNEDYGQNEPINNEDRIRSHYNNDSSENSSSGRRARLVMHASNSRIDDPIVIIRDSEHDDQGNRSSQERHVRERRSRSPSISHQRSDPINSTIANYSTYYSDRDRDDLYSRSSNNLSSIKDNEGGELDRNRTVNFLDGLQISDTNDSSRYRNDDSRSIKSNINDFSRYNDNGYDGTSRSYDHYNQSSLDSSSNVRNDGTFYNNSNNRHGFNSENEFTNTISRHKPSFRLRNMYQEDSTTAEEVMDDTDSNAGNDMDTTDNEDTEDEDFRRCFSHDEDNISTTSISSPIRNEPNPWYKPWSWYNNNHFISGTASSPASAVADVDSDATISSDVSTHGVAVNLEKKLHRAQQKV